MTTFNEAKKRNFRKLKLFMPIVARVHGANHPEFHEVRKVFGEISDKTKKSRSAKPDLANEFKRLRELTDNYTVPGDVCESYQAVYEMLAAVDQAYQG